MTEIIAKNKQTGRSFTAFEGTEVPCGLAGANRHMEPGYVLASGVVLLETEKDGRGNYIGGAGMDGMYLRTPTRYAPVKNGDGSVRAFFKVEEKQRNLISPQKQHEPER